MPELSLSERLFDLAMCVESARRIAETLDLGVPDSTLSFKLEDLSRVHAIASGIARLLAPASDQLSELSELFLTLERNPS
ncbi:MAG: hypothetical protein LBI31_01585 [Zoogloeaceae bacterium]|nr:hypothetical protein [Zoogloeaceae bacterium]